jgi:5-hydroxyisourate hydrolase-like protein (transthyretin family)
MAEAGDKSMCGDQRSIGRAYSLGTGWAVLVSLMVALGLTSPAAASAAEATGKITGKVTSASSKAAIAGIEVCAAENLFEAELFGHCAKTDQSGEYSISGLSAGIYGVGFFAPEGGGLNYIPQYYNDRPSIYEAEQIVVEAGQTKSGVNAAMQVGGQITGQVTSASSKAALAGIEVCAYGTDDEPRFVDQCAKTNSSGEYTVSGLANGSYRVGFFAPEGGGMNYIFQYYDGKSSYSEDEQVAVEVGRAKSGINAALQAGGQISGKVTSASTKDAVAGVQVCASSEVDGQCAKTNSSGEYTVLGLPTGSYEVYFYAPEGLNYLTQYYNGKSSYSEAESVLVTAGATTSGINAAMSEGGEITGKVTASSSKEALSGIEACPLAIGGDDGGQCVTTNSGGEYTITGLATGQYKVEFYPNGTQNYLTQFYNGKPSASEADTVSVTAGSTTSEINAALVAGGQITGKVTDAAGSTPLPDIQVSVYEANGSYPVAYAVTDSSGEYTAARLSVGEYKVQFAPEYDAGNYLGQYYRDQPSLAAAGSVKVTAEKTTSGIDASLQAGGAITGQVRNASTKSATADIGICPLKASGELAGECTTSNSAGEYTLSRLETAEYRVEFYAIDGANYLTQFYDGEASFTEASAVAVTAGATKSGVDAAMIVGGEITGKVTDAASKAALPSIEVCAYEHDSDYYGSCTYTGPDGEYTIPSLTTGEYRVEFSDPSDYHFTQYYEEKDSFYEAGPVSVVTGKATEGIDAAMRAAGAITGTVTSVSGGGPLENIQVCAQAVNGGYAGRCTTTNSAGEYTLGPLATGEYTVEFSSTAGAYASQYYNGRSSAAEANPVLVSVGSTTREIDAAMTPGGQIAGKVTSKATMTALGGIEVCADERGGELVDRCASSSSSGEYTIADLPTGGYTVEFYSTSESAPYLRQYYEGKESSSEAGVVSVTVGAKTSGINAALVTGGQITGKVTDAASKALLAGVDVCAYVSGEDLFGHCASTSSSGEYTITGLPSGKYTVEFYPAYETNYELQYYDAKPSSSEANAVPVTKEVTTSGIDAALVPEGEVTGKVTAASSGDPLSGVQVCAYEYGDDRLGGCVSTSSSGEYEVGGLLTGEYTIEFDPASGTGYLPQYYKDKSSSSEANTVPVTAGTATPSVDAAMVMGGRVVGKVSAAANKASLEGIQVCAYERKDDAVGGCSSTSSSGEYTITGLSAGEYTVEFYANAGYLAQYYSDKASTTSGIDAAMVTKGSITGVVTGAASKAPLDGVEVCAYERGDDLFGGCTETSSSGEYAIANLPAGEYTVEFVAPSETNYLSQYYSGKTAYSEADGVPVTDESTTSGIDAALVAGGEIAGKVTSALTNTEIEGVDVCAIERGGAFIERCAYTDASGEYTIAGLYTGEYTVEFYADNDMYFTQYYNGKASSSEANAVSVTAGVKASGIDAAMRGGQITGKVTEASTTGALEDIEVCAYEGEDDLFGRCASTNSAGEYAIVGLATGKYKVKFYAGSGANYLTQYYDGESSVSKADAVSVSDDSVTSGIDAEMVIGGKITGEVTSASSEEGVEGIEVCAYSPGGESDGCASTGSSGEYTIVGLATGQYSVEFYSRGGAYVTQYYNGASLPSEASPVSVTAGSTVSGVDAAMVSKGEIAGTVTNAATNVALDEIKVCAYERGDERLAGCSLTNHAGEYAIGDLASAEYDVEFSSPSGVYLTRNYNGETSSPEATPVSVSAGSITSGIDAAMVAGGKINGKVTAASTKAPLEKIEICAEGAGGGLFGACASSNAAGEYTIVGLATGKYAVEFFSQSVSYLTQYYKDKSTLAQASSVSVTEEATTSGIDAAMVLGGKIAGTVTGASTKAALAGVEVCAHPIGGEGASCESTSSAGEYLIAGLATGEYTVEFAPDGPYVTQYYDGKATSPEATPVSVTAESTTPGIDAAMVADGGIAGKVTDASSKAPLEGIEVCAQELAGELGRACVSTNASGEYAIANLPTGEYEITFYSPSNTYLTQYYDDEVSSSKATLVSVGAGSTASGIDAAMVAGGAIAGKVSDASTEAPLEGIEVCAEEFEGDQLFGACADTNAAGEYTIGNLPAGSYTVEFLSRSNVYLTQYYEGKASASKSNPVSVAAGSTTPAIDAAMVAGGQIAGQVTSASGKARLAGVEVCAQELVHDLAGGCASTNVDGEYTIDGLATGEYAVEFSLGGTYVTQYYDGGSLLSEASPVSVTAGSTTPGIDAAMTAAGQIAGTVTSASTDAALEGIQACAYYDSAESPAGCATTNAVGEYAIAGLPAGEYYVEFSSTNSSVLGGAYLTQYYDGKSLLSEASPVSVTAGATAPGIDAAMIAGGQITGKATSASTDAALEGVAACAYGVGKAAPAGCATTNAVGEYAIVDLPVGEYTVEFSAPSTGDLNYLGQYYEDKPASSEADVIHVTTGSTTAGIDAAMVVGGQIAGTVREATTGVVLAGIEVCALPAEGVGFVRRCTTTNSGGEYAIAALATGDYDVSFSSPSGNYAGQYYNAKTSLALANAVAVEAGATSNGIDAELASVPQSQSPPRITGQAEEGQALTEVHGSWTNNPTGYSYQWERCDTNGANCQAIAGATQQTYTPDAADVGHELRVTETARNLAGASSPSSSEPTAVVKARVEVPVPASLEPPSISGVAQQGEVLVSTGGSWSNEPISYSYQWLRCEAGGTNCQAIVGAVEQTYALTAADLGHELEVEEDARNAGGWGPAVESAPSVPVTAQVLHADAGEDVEAIAGTPVRLDGSGSSPRALIASYRWEPGDGASVSGASIEHTYTAPGIYSAKLTVGDANTSASDTVSVHVLPASTPAAQVTVRESGGGAPIPGAEVVYMSPEDVRLEAYADGEGVATLAGLPDGDDAIYAYASGYQPAAGSIQVSSGAGQATIELHNGPVALTTLKDHEMDLKEIEAAGIETENPENQNVYEFEVRLSFEASEEHAGETTVQCYVNGDGKFVGECTEGGASAAGDITCSETECEGGGGAGGGSGSFVAVPTVVDNHPLIQWLILRGKATVLKQFFSVSMVVQNLSSSEPFKITQGGATLDLPAGLSLAPTESPQSAAQAVADVPPAGSSAVSWIVRGDEPGEYHLSASYQGQLEPFKAPIDLEAQLANPLKVWGANALALKVQADSGALAPGVPYHVRVGVTNKADVPLYNVSVAIDSEVHKQFIFQPDQQFANTIAELAPGETVYDKPLILVPDAASVSAFDPALSSAHFIGEEVKPGVGIEAVPPPPLYSLTAPTDTPDMVHLHWQSVPEAEGYEVFPIPDLDTPFAEEPTPVLASPSSEEEVLRLPAGSTDAYMFAKSSEPSKYYAVSALIKGTPTLEFPVIEGVPGEEPAAGSGGGGGGGGAGAGGGVLGYSGSSSGSEEGAGIPTPTCALHSESLPGGITVDASCFHKLASGQLDASGHIRVNGVDIYAPGGVTLDPSTLELTSTGQVEVHAGTILLYRGQLDWRLQASLSLEVPGGATIKGLPISGNVTISLVAGGARATVNAAIAGNFSVSGTVQLELTLDAGLKLKGLSLTLASDLPIKDLVVKKAKISYRQTSAGDVWEGAVQIELPAKLPTIEGVLAITNGRISEVAVRATSINRPLGDDGAFLQSLGLAVVFKPLTVTGSIGVSAGPSIKGKTAASLDGSLSATFGDPFVLEARGDVYLVDEEIASAWLKTSVPGGVEFGGQEKRTFDGIGVEGGIQGRINAHEFEAQGHATVSAGVASASGDALVNNVGLAGCATATIGIGYHQTVSIGGAHRWSGQNSVFNDSCGFGRLQSALDARVSAAGAAKTVRVPAHVGQINLIVHGTDGPPEVMLTRGSQVADISPNTDGAFAGAAYIAVADGGEGDTDIAIAGLSGGTIAVSAPAGQPALEAVGSVLPLPKPDVHVQIHQVGGRRYRLTWSARQIPGQRLVFEDTNTRGQVRLLSTTRSHGQIVFTALDNGASGPQRLRVVVDQDALPREVLTGPVLHPTAVHVGEPHVDVRLAGTTDVVSWSAVQNAASYEVSVSTSDGRHLFFAVGAHDRSLRIAAATQAQAMVRGVGEGMQQGPFGVGRLTSHKSEIGGSNAVPRQTKRG